MWVPSLRKEKKTTTTKRAKHGDCENFYTILHRDFRVVEKERLPSPTVVFVVDSI